MSMLPNRSSEPLLLVENLSVHFGGVRALDGVNLSVAPGLVHGLVGPNGSGKTTLINCISGFVRATSGSIVFEGVDVSGHSSSRRARAGVARTFQHPQCFDDFDARTNVHIGAHTVDGANWLRSFFVPSNAAMPELADRIDRMLERVGVSDSRQPVSDLSYGNQRLVDAARAVVRRPRIVLLDEPVAGLGGTEIDNLTRYVRWLVGEGITVVITDHNMDFMMEICDVLTVLNFGKAIAEGTPDVIRADEKVIAAYLGSGRVVSAMDARPEPPEPQVSPDAKGHLEVTDLVARYNTGLVLHSISFSMQPGQIRTLVGANGAGKSTTLLTLSGIVKPAGGRIELDGERIDNLSPAAIVRRGIAHVPEGRRVLSGLTVAENLAMGAYTVRDGKLVHERLGDVYGLLPVLADRRKQLAGSLSGGEQQMLAMGRALMSGPSVLLLDEPTMGLSPIMVDRVLELIVELRDRGVTIALLEQNASAALTIAQYAYVLSMGRIVAEGRPAELVASDALENAYLGSD